MIVEAAEAWGLKEEVTEYRVRPEANGQGREYQPWEHNSSCATVDITKGPANTPRPAWIGHPLTESFQDPEYKPRDSDYKSIPLSLSPTPTKKHNSPPIDPSATLG